MDAEHFWSSVGHFVNADVAKALGATLKMIAEDNVLLVVEPEAALAGVVATGVCGSVTNALL